LIGDSFADGSATAAGGDDVLGLGGDDLLFGDNSNVAATIGSAGGEDRLDGGTGDDALFAGPAADSLDGGAHTDFCDGEAGADSFARCEAVSGAP
jgi:Ca2+-binding RTX toxin-like protein